MKSFTEKRRWKILAFSLSLIGLIIQNSKEATISNWLIFWIYAPFAASFIIDSIIDNTDTKKEKYRDLKWEVDKFIHRYLEINATWDLSYAGTYLPFKKIFVRFEKDGIDKIEKIISEHEYYSHYSLDDIKKYIHSDIPDMYISKNDLKILAVIRFSSGLNPIPYLYDINGSFLGIIIEDKYLINKEGIYKGKLLNTGSYFYAESIDFKGVTVRYKHMPNITYTESQLKTIAEINNEPYKADLYREVKNIVVMDSI